MSGSRFEARFAEIRSIANVSSHVALLYEKAAVCFKMSVFAIDFRTAKEAESVLRNTGSSTAAIVWLSGAGASFFCFRLACGAAQIFCVARRVKNGQTADDS